MTTVAPPEQTTDRPLRMVRMSANLLPVEILDSRRERKVRRIVLAALAGFLVVMSAWYALARYGTADAQDTLNEAKASATRLQNQQHQYNDLVQVQAQTQAINQELTGLFAHDVQWSALLPKVRDAVPAGVYLTTINVGVNDPRAAQAGVQFGKLPNTAGSDPIGTLSVIGVANSKALVAQYVDALGGISTLGNSYVNSVTLLDGKYQFSIELDILATALSSRYPASGSK